MKDIGIEKEPNGNEILKLEKQLNSYKIEHLERINSKFKELIFDCLMLIEHNDIVRVNYECDDEKTNFQFPYKGEVEFISECVSTLNEFKAFVCNEEFQFEIIGAYDKINYVTSMHKCLDSFSLLIKYGKKFLLTIDDWIDCGWQSYPPYSTAYEMFKSALDISNKVVNETLVHGCNPYHFAMADIKNFDNMITANNCES